MPKIINLKEPHFPSNENEGKLRKTKCKEEFTSIVCSLITYSSKMNMMNHLAQSALFKLR